MVFGNQESVCSNHFPDGSPTDKKPLPTLLLGYDAKRKLENVSAVSKRGKIQRQFEGMREGKRNSVEKTNSEGEETNYSTFVCDNLDDFRSFDVLVLILKTAIIFQIHVVSSILPLVFIRTVSQNLANSSTKGDSFRNFLAGYLLKEIQSLKRKVKHLELKLRNCKCSTTFDEKLLCSDHDVAQLTSIVSLPLFDKLHAKIKPLIRRKWRSAQVVKQIKRKYTKSSKKIGSKRKLSSRQEFLLTMMKLRLGLCDYDLAKRFGVSVATVSRTFSTWVKGISTYLKPLLIMPSIEQIYGSRPPRFDKFPNLHSILDATEIFLETPKKLALQRSTCSRYKHHNTAKILVAVAPNSAIVFASNAYCGSISDKQLTMDCGLLENVELYSDIMVDKGFNITEECNFRHINVLIPLGKRGQSQMSASDVKKTQEIAKSRILKEQEIRRLKMFKIIANEMPVTLTRHIDDIITICCVLTNFRKPIYTI